MVHAFERHEKCASIPPLRLHRFCFFLRCEWPKLLHLVPSSFLTLWLRPQTPLSIIRIVATTDGERYTVVDISGAPDGPWIRRRILAKVAADPSYLKHFLSRTDHHPFFVTARHRWTTPSSVLDLSVGSWCFRPGRCLERQKALCVMSRKRESFWVSQVLCVPFTRSVILKHTTHTTHKSKVPVE